MEKIIFKNREEFEAGVVSGIEFGLCASAHKQLEVLNVHYQRDNLDPSDEGNYLDDYFQGVLEHPEYTRYKFYRGCAACAGSIEFS